VAWRVFKYLNCSCPKKWIRLDPGEHFPGGTINELLKGMKLEWDYYYFGAKEERDPKDPKPATKGCEDGFDTSACFDSNFAHDKVTRGSVTSTVTYISNTPVPWLSKRQGGVIATSTYSAELQQSKDSKDMKK
jgi:hypothetical protein